MSEYQSYEFRALERPLSSEAREELRGLSSRAQITAHSFSNEYNWGDFRGSPEQMVRDWFDLFVYWANWGTRWCMVRVPLANTDVAALRRYEGGYVRVSVTDTHAVISFELDDEAYRDIDWETIWIDELLPIRAEILAGDLRSLYIGWLADAEWECPDEDELPPPPRPPGMGRPSDAQRALARFLFVPDDLLDAAGQGATDCLAPFDEAGL